MGLSDFEIRLIEETEELAQKTNKLNDFMRTQKFYELPRPHKDLLYEQYHAMLNYLQVLGKRLELLSIKIKIYEPDNLEKGE